MGLTNGLAFDELLRAVVGKVDAFHEPLGERVDGGDARSQDGHEDVEEGTEASDPDAHQPQNDEPDDAPEHFATARHD